MISFKDLKKAIKYYNSKWDLESESEIVRQLVSSLDVYRERQEFDGTLETAIECLTLAGYEIKGGSK